MNISHEQHQANALKRIYRETGCINTFCSVVFNELEIGAAQAKVFYCLIKEINDLLNVENGWTEK
jgi:hypothetical protein